MKKSILVFAQEAGSAGILLPIIDKLKSAGYSISIYALPPALYFFKRNFTDVKEWTEFSEDKYSMLLTGYGHPRHPVSRLIFKEARRRNLKTVVLLDNWKGFERFFDITGRISEDVPDIITVIDDESKASLTEMGAPAAKIRVIGHPYLEYISNRKITDEDRITARRMLKLPISNKIAFFASELLHNHSYYEQCSLVRDEYSGTNSIKSGGFKSDSAVKGCCSLINAKVHNMPLIRHIMETRKWKDFVFAARPHPNEKLIPAKDVIVIKWEDADETVILNAVDVVFGLSSFFVSLAVSSGVPTFNVEPFLHDWKPENSYLTPRLWKYLSGKGYMGNWRDVKASIPDNRGAIERVIKIIEEVIVCSTG